MPVGGTVGYELFDEASPFTTSDFLANVNLRRAVEGELARTIGTLRSVRSARVTSWSSPSAACSAARRSTPTASIVLALRGAAPLDKRQVAGIRQLVAAAVPGLAAGRRHPGRRRRQPPGRARRHRAPTRWPDRRCRGVSGGAREPACAARSSSCSSARSARARSMPRSAPTSTSTRWRPPPRLYDPQSQVVRSTQTTEEASDQQETQPADAGGCRQQPADRARGAPDRGRARSSERATRPRRPSTTRSRAPSATRPSAAPRCARLSIAVQVDGIYRDAAGRRPAYEPRGAEELDAAGGPGPQRRRRRREPRRRGRGGQPAVRRRLRRSPSPRPRLAGRRCSPPTMPASSSSAC